MTLSPDGKILINTSETTNMAHFIDTATRQIVANVLVDARPRFAAFKRDSSELWVSSEIGGTVSHHRSRQARRSPARSTSAFPACGAKRSSRSASASPGTARPPSSRLAPPTASPSSTPPRHAVTKYLLVGQRVWHMAFTPDEKYLLVTNGVSNDVSVIDVSAQKVIKTIQVGELPWGITFAQP